MSTALTVVYELAIGTALICAATLALMMTVGLVRSAYLSWKGED